MYMPSTPSGLIAASTILYSFSGKVGSTFMHYCPYQTSATKCPELSPLPKQAILCASYSYFTPKVYFAPSALPARYKRGSSARALSALRPSPDRVPRQYHMEKAKKLGRQRGATDPTCPTLRGSARADWQSSRHCPSATSAAPDRVRGSGRTGQLARGTAPTEDGATGAGPRLITDGLRQVPSRLASMRARTRI